VKLRIYTDTSVLGGCEDEEFADHSVRLLDYIEAAVLTARMRADAQHIAIATVGRVDVLLSWNFKHIVNLQRIQGYNSVNLRNGYSIDRDPDSPRGVVR